MRPKSPKLTNRLFGVLAFLLLVHILLSILIVFSPRIREYFKKSIISHYYKDYAVIGPFFTASSVRSSHDISISFKENEWSNWVYPVKKNHQNYLRSGSFSSLKRARFENFLTRSFYTDRLTEESKQQTDKSNIKNYALKYFAKEYCLQGEFDSIQVVILSNSLNQSELQIDTIQTDKYLVP